MRASESSHCLKVYLKLSILDIIGEWFSGRNPGWNSEYYCRFRCTHPFFPHFSSTLPSLHHIFSGNSIDLPYSWHASLCRCFCCCFRFSKSPLVQQYDSFNINKCKSKEKNIQHEKTEHNKFYDYAMKNTECYIEIGPCLWARNVTLSQWTNFNAVHSMPCAFYFINKHVSACVWVCICIWIFKLCSSEWEQISLWKNLE